VIRTLCKTGDNVKAGEGIAITGESGENKTGTQFYFELWKQGKPVNPEDVIIF
jgi:septal ring factor EnvC (AmiA/AmiB activator)